MADYGDSRAKPLIGLAYIVVLIGLVALSIVAYLRAFPWQRMVEVDLATRQVGLQLNPRSDVKIKGVVVGQVKPITSDGGNATVRLALDPAKVPLIPADVDAAIVPKTLFGEKQVNLLARPGSTAPRIAHGNTIRQSTTAVEIGQLYSELHAVLDTLRPEQLSLALNALAHALHGQGARLGDTAARLNTYLGKINPHLPTVVHDIEQLATTADVYTEAAPDLLRVLDNGSSISAELLVPHERPLAEFLTQSITAADEATDLADRNGRTVVALTGRARPVLELAAEYARALPCVFDTLALQNAALNHALGGEGPWLTASIDLVVQNAPYRYPEDLPANRSSSANNATLPPGVPGWGPHCAVVPSQLRDVRNVGPLELATRGPVAPAGSGAAEDSQRALTGALGGQLMGVPPSEVPGTARLLLLPLLLDGKVEVP